MNSEIGECVWLKDSKESWLLHKCTGFTDSGAALLELQAPFAGASGTKARATKKLTAKNSRRCDPTHTDAEMNDVSELNEVSEAAVLGVLRRRLYAGHIYTAVADILIVVNPFKMVTNAEYPRGIESTDMCPMQMREEGALPHIYRTADLAYMEMLKSGRDQGCIMSGESGAGKTIQTKLIMRYLAFICQKEAASSRGGGGSSSSSRSRGSFRGAAHPSPQGRNDRLAKDVRRRSTVALLATTRSRFPGGGGGGVRRPSLIPANAARLSMETAILNCNCFLEAFGNAKTPMNDNSSRFGKFIKLFYRHRTICGAAMQEFLLEKGRITKRSAGHHAYHIFRLLASGAPAELRATLRLRSPLTYTMLAAEAAECNPEADAAYFDECCESLHGIAVGERERGDLWRAIGALLELRDVKWRAGSSAGGNAAVSVKNVETIERAADLLSIQGGAEMLLSNLRIRTLTTRGSTTTVNLTSRGAEESVHALIKDIYSRTFSHLVQRANVQLAPRVEPQSYIGLLDIFGFEIFEVNSFEQLCINYCNEKLQSLFNYHVFELEKAVYEDEGVDWRSFEWQNNKPCLLLFDGAKKGYVGLLPRLDDASKSKREKVTDEMLVRGYHQWFDTTSSGWDAQIRGVSSDVAKKYRSASAFFKAGSRFAGGGGNTLFQVVHFAGVVMYDATGFIAKNADKLHDHLALALSHCGNSFVRALYESSEDAAKRKKSGNRGLHPSLASAAGGTAAAGQGGTAAKLERRKRKKGRTATTAGTFTAQLKALTSTLMATNLHFVRCIKSNDAKLPYDAGIKACNGPGVMRQLLFSGVLETIKIRRQGYPSRHEFAPLWEMFRRRNWHYLAGMSASNASSIDPKDGCTAVLAKALAPGEFAVGHTKIFAKYGALEAVEMWARALVAKRLTGFVRGRLGRLWFLRMRREKMEREFARVLPMIKSAQALARAAAACNILSRMRKGKAERDRLRAEKIAREAHERELQRLRDEAATLAQARVDAAEAAAEVADLASEAANAAMHAIDELIRAVAADISACADEAAAVARAASDAAQLAAEVDSMFSGETLARARCARMQKLDALMRRRAQADPSGAAFADGHIASYISSAQNKLQASPTPRGVVDVVWESMTQVTLRPAADVPNSPDASYTSPPPQLRGRFDHESGEGGARDGGRRTSSSTTATTLAAAAAATDDGDYLGEGWMDGRGPPGRAGSWLAIPRQPTNGSLDHVSSTAPGYATYDRSKSQPFRAGSGHEDLRSLHAMHDQQQRSRFQSTDGTVAWRRDYAPTAAAMSTAGQPPFRAVDRRAGRTNSIIRQAVALVREPPVAVGSDRSRAPPPPPDAPLGLSRHGYYGVGGASSATSLMPHAQAAPEATVVDGSPPRGWAGNMAPPRRNSTFSGVARPSNSAEERSMRYAQRQFLEAEARQRGELRRREVEEQQELARMSFAEEAQKELARSHRAAFERREQERTQRRWREAVGDAVRTTRTTRFR